jgi:hypothetical protein
MYNSDHHTVSFQIYVLLFIFPLYVALRDQHHEVPQACCYEKPGIGALGIDIDSHGLLQSANPKKKATLDWGIQQSGMKNQELQHTGIV